MRLFSRQRVQFITLRLALVALLGLFGGAFSYPLCLNASPTNTISIPNSFTPNTTIQSSQTNANNNEIQTKFNAHSHTDITQLGTITTGTWAATAVGTQYGGTGQNFSAATSGVIHFSTTGTFANLAANASGNSLTLVGQAATWGKVDLAVGVKNILPGTNAPVGSAVQVVNTQVATTASGSVAIPIDDSIPQNGEGTEYMTLAITPTSATNKLKIDIVFNVGSGANELLTIALFQDSTANALYCASKKLGATGQEAETFYGTYYMTSGTTSATTFKVRAGNSGTTTQYMNGNSSGRQYGGALISSITITEIKA